MKDNEKEIEQLDENNKSWWKKFVGLKPNLWTVWLKFCLLFLAFVVFVINGVILFNSREGLGVKKNNIFEKYTFKKISKFIDSRDIRSTATELNDGRILFVGGMNKNCLSSSEIYNPNHNKFNKTANLNIPRARHAAVLLKNGNVLVTGGNTEIDGKYKSLKSAEIYDVNSNQFIRIPDMNYEMTYHNMFLLEDGNVLVVSNPWKIEIYDSKKSEFKKLEGISIENRDEIYNFLLLSENKLFMYPRTYIPEKTPLVMLNLVDLSFTELKIHLFEKVNSFYNIAKISENKLLVTGGNKNQLSSKIININNMEVSKNLNLSQKRYNHISIKLDDNNILLLGGESGVADTLEDLKTTDLYNSNKNKFIKFKNMNYKRSTCRYLKLSNGNYLIYGGSSVLGKNQSPEILILREKE